MKLQLEGRNSSLIPLINIENLAISGHKENKPNHFLILNHLKYIYFW